MVYDSHAADHVMKFPRPSPFCILQGIKNWRHRRPGNEANCTHYCTHKYIHYCTHKYTHLLHTQIHTLLHTQNTYTIAHTKYIHYCTHKIHTLLHTQTHTYTIIAYAHTYIPEIYSLLVLKMKKMNEGMFWCQGSPNSKTILLSWDVHLQLSCAQEACRLLCNWKDIRHNFARPYDHGMVRIMVGLRICDDGEQRHLRRNAKWEWLWVCDDEEQRYHRCNAKWEWNARIKKQKGSKRVLQRIYYFRNYMEMEIELRPPMDVCCMLKEDSWQWERGGERWLNDSL